MTYSFRSDCMPLNNLVVNQTLDIKAQLKAGIRALDMRVRLDNGQFLCVHSGELGVPGVSIALDPTFLNSC